MFRSISIAIVAVAAASLLGTTAFAQDPDLTCDDIEFTSLVTSQYPDVMDACQDVVERDGKKYARLSAEMVRYLPVSGEIRLRFKERDGDYGEVVAIKPQAPLNIRLGGRRVAVRNVARGQEFNIYLPQDRWAVAVLEDEVVVEELYDVDELPSTASPFPLLGALGLGLLGLGGALSLRRRSQ